MLEVGNPLGKTLRKPMVGNTWRPGDLQTSPLYTKFNLTKVFIFNEPSKLALSLTRCHDLSCWMRGLLTRHKTGTWEDDDPGATFSYAELTVQQRSVQGSECAEMRKDEIDEDVHDSMLRPTLVNVPPVYTEATWWTSWCLKSPATRLVLQQLVNASDKVNVKFPQY